MLKLFGIYIFILLVSLPSFAVKVFEDLPKDQCTTGEVDTKKLPDNRDQDALGICHAFTTADILSFYTGKKISAYGIVADIYQRDERTGKEALSKYGGWPGGDLFELGQGGGKLCLESNFKPISNDWSSFSKALKLTDLYRDIFDQFYCSKDVANFSSGVDSTTLNTIKKLSGSQFTVAVIRSTCKETTDMKLGTSYATVARDDGSIEFTCEMKAKGCNSRNSKDANLNLTYLDGWIGKNEPVMLYYDGALLFNRPGFINRNMNHASTLIARKYNDETKECEYLIRNSWGTNCKVYPAKYKCTDGNIWIPRLDLLKSLHGYEVFQPQ